MLSTKASGAKVEAFFFAIYGNRNWVYVRHPATIGMPLGVTDIMSKLRRLSTQITLQYIFSLTIGLVYSILCYYIITVYVT